MKAFLLAAFCLLHSAFCLLPSAFCTAQEVPQAEVLQRLTATPRLTCRTKLYAWPTGGTVRPEYAGHLDQCARILGTEPLSWRWTNEAGVEAAVARCLRVDAKLCLHVSPKVPDMGSCLCDERLAYVARWEEIVGLIAGRVEIAVVICDLEGERPPHPAFRYDLTQPTTGAIRANNEQVADYNRMVYNEARKFIPPEVQFLRWGHLAVGSQGHPDYGPRRVAAYSSPTDPVDGGFSLSWYSPLQMATQKRKLRDTILHAKHWGINEGSLWLSLGISTAAGGGDAPVPYPRLSDSSTFYAWPYDPKLSFDVGSWFSDHWWWAASVHGESQRNGSHPQYNRIHSVILYPGVFREGADLTNGVHLCAFFLGLGNQPWDPALTALQARQWEEWKAE